MDQKLAIASRAKKFEKTHDPLALVAHTSSSSQSPSPNYVTHPPSVVDYDDEYQGETFQNDSEDPITYAMMLLARAITQRYSTPTNNRLCSSLNIRNQAVVQADIVNIQRRNLGNDGIIARHSYNVQEESAEGSNFQKETGNPRVRDSKYFMEQILLAKKDEVGVILSNEKNDFFLVDALQMEDLDELSVNICMMAKIQLADIESDEGPSYDSAFISEVQTPSTSYMNMLFSDSNHEQTYHEQPKIINSTIRDDQINSDIIFDDLNVKANSGSVEHDKNAHDSHDNELEQLARNAYKDAEKQQIIAENVKQQNVELTKQLEHYTRKVQVFETTKENKTNFHKEFIKADRKAKRLECELQNQFILDRDKISALEKEIDDLQLNFPEEVKTMMDVFESMESDLDATWKQNEILNDQLLEATLKYDVEKLC
ncbi:hypothetical protein Tco_0768172 [Tanacetum coccineum]